MIQLPPLTTPTDTHFPLSSLFRFFSLFSFFLGTRFPILFPCPPSPSKILLTLNSANSSTLSTLNPTPNPSPLLLLSVLLSAHSCLKYGFIDQIGRAHV